MRVDVLQIAGIRAAKPRSVNRPVRLGQNPLDHEHADIDHAVLNQVQLHQLAMAATNEGSRSQVAGLFGCRLGGAGFLHDDRAGAGAGNTFRTDRAILAESVPRRL